MKDFLIAWIAVKQVASDQEGVCNVVGILILIKKLKCRMRSFMNYIRGERNAEYRSDKTDTERKSR